MQYEQVAYTNGNRITKRVIRVTLSRNELEVFLTGDGITLMRGFPDGTVLVMDVEGSPEPDFLTACDPGDET